MAETPCFFCVLRRQLQADEETGKMEIQNCREDMS